MPYIKQEDRDDILVEVPMLGWVLDFQSIDCAGELNYAFTLLAKRYLKKKGLNYQHINDVLGAFIGAKDEFERRVVIPYEDVKIADNGDVE